MPEERDDDVGRLAAEISRGSIVAPAGCGKTEQVVRAVEFSKRRRLILTHTHAGVDAISRRLKSRNVPSERYRIDTIAGWCLRVASAFPKRSGISAIAPKSSNDWSSVYAGAVQLIQSGAISGIVDASYGGLLVDEYQDCTRQQHQVVRMLAEQLPTCVFGDPLQAIFDFGDQGSVDWSTDVFPDFPEAGRLRTPWRWKKVGNFELAEWLIEVRRDLERGETISLYRRPACVKWSWMPSDLRFQQQAIIKECLAAMGEVKGGEHLIIIGDSANINSRASLAAKLSQKGFSNIEPVNSKEIYSAAKAIEQEVGYERFKAILAFTCKCMTGTEKAAFEEAISSRLAGRKKGQAKFGDLFPLIDRIISVGSEADLLEFLQSMQVRAGTHLFRREMFFCMRSALQVKSSRQHGTLGDAVWEVQNRLRHTGRKFGKRSIGSALLVKGLEFEHSVVVHSPNMTRKEWYVALTRSTNGVRVISPGQRITPPDHA